MLCFISIFAGTASALGTLAASVVSFRKSTAILELKIILRIFDQNIVMSTLELQEQLISKIQITTNEDILAGVLRLLEFETANDEPYVFNDEQKNAIAKARQQVSNGKFYTDEEVDKLTDEWLRE